MRIYIATSREIGERCKAWAKANISPNHELVNNPEYCDVFISVLYDTLITPDFISKHRCYNFHPGVLPWYRGAGAYSWAIINGEFETGVTLHVIDKDIDHGPILDIERFPISKFDTAGSLFTIAENTIYNMFKAWFDRLLVNYPVTGLEQEEGRIYYRKDLEKTKDLTRFIRAFTFEGKESAYYINYKGEKIYINL